MTKFEAGESYIANGSYAFEGEIKTITIEDRTLSKRGYPVVIIEGQQWRIETDQEGEYALIGAMWSVHSKN